MDPFLEARLLTTRRHLLGSMAGGMTEIYQEGLRIPPVRLYRAGKLQQITRDHSLLQEQIDAGLISPEQAQYATHKNLVTRALGVEDTVLLEVNEFRVEDGDLYLFCSDGSRGTRTPSTPTWGAPQGLLKA